jgi:hypothetical protein
LDTGLDINIAILKDTITLYAALLDFLKGSLKFVDEVAAMRAIRATFKQSHIQEKKGSLADAMKRLNSTLGAASGILHLRKDQMEKDSTMLNQVSPLTFRERHQNFRDLHVAGTGKWILEDKTFLQWIKSSRRKASVLWCFGIGRSYQYQISTSEMLTMNE